MPETLRKFLFFSFMFLIDFLHDSTHANPMGYLFQLDSLLTQNFILQAEVFPLLKFFSRFVFLSGEVVPQKNIFQTAYRILGKLFYLSIPLK